MFKAYIPMDRRQAMARNVALADRTEGAALFADISGFTPLTEALARTLGPRRGAEELTTHLNSVYEALIREVDCYGGSVIAFAGDAITCWFQDDDGRRATTAALAMQKTMAQFAEVRLPSGEKISLAVKIGIAAGPARRFLVGDRQVQVLDVLAGRTLGRMAAAAQHAARGEVLLEGGAAASLGETLEVAGWKSDEAGGGAFAVVKGCRTPVPPAVWPQLPDLQEAEVRPWLLQPVYERLRAGQGEFLTELRPAVALFTKFEGIDYDNDDRAGEKLNTYVCWTQRVLAQYGGFLIDVAIGDKGSYLYACFGAPVAHENDAWRALTTAGELIAPPAQLSFITATHIGISRGTMRTGAYGGSTRRTYGALGDGVNLAARLMEHAAAGQVLVSERVQRDVRELFRWEARPPIKVKGKATPAPVFGLAGAETRSVGSGLMEPAYTLPMVGRQAELELVERKLKSALSGRGQVVAISAEAGMGKSRLVAEITRLASQAHLRCFGGQCQSFGTNASYLVWWSIWRGLFGVDPAQSPGEQFAAVESKLREVDPMLMLVSRLPLLGSVLNLPIPENDITAPLEAKLRKSSLEALLVECLRSLSKKQPLLLILEDTHWIDALSQELLEELARAVSQLPVLVVITQRPTEPGAVSAQNLQQLAHFTELVLDAFTDQQAAQLIQLKLEQLFNFRGPVPPLLLGRLAARSSGNPFYLEELLNFLKDQNVDFQDADAVGALDLPTSLQSLVLSRIDRLTENQQAALKVASVIGRLFPEAVVWGLQPQTAREQVSADLVRLCEAGLAALDRPDPELVYIFKHVVTQEVAYESLPHATRQRLHNEIGLRLEELYAGKLEQQLDLLAFHFDRSLNVAKRSHYLQKAGEAAQARYANTAAISYFDRVLPLLSAAEQGAIFLRMGKVWELMGQWKKAGTCYQQSFEIAESLSDKAAQARCQAATGDLFRKEGFYAEATNWLTLARDSFQALGDHAGVGQSLHAAGTVAAMQGSYDQAQALYEQSLAIRQRLDDKAQIASLLSNLGIIARFQANYDNARKLMEQSLEIRRQVGDRWAIANSLNNLGVLWRDLGEYHRAREVLEESLSLNRQVGDRWAIANTLSSLAEVAIDQKDWPGARDFLQESLQINLQLGDRTAVAFILECFAGMAAAQAKAARAIHLAGAASALRLHIGSPLSPAEQQRLETNLKPARQAVSPEQSVLLFQQGSDMGLDKALAAALDQP